MPSIVPFTRRKLRNLAPISRWQTRDRKDISYLEKVNRLTTVLIPSLLSRSTHTRQRPTLYHTTLLPPYSMPIRHAVRHTPHPAHSHPHTPLIHQIPRNTLQNSIYVSTWSSGTTRETSARRIPTCRTTDVLPTVLWLLRTKATPSSSTIIIVYRSQPHFRLFDVEEGIASDTKPSTLSCPSCYH